MRPPGRPCRWSGHRFRDREQLRDEYEIHLRVLAAAPRTDDRDQEGTTALRRHQQMTEPRLALLSRKRTTIISLRDDNKIDDAVLLHLQAQLDAEETRLRRTALE